MKERQFSDDAEECSICLDEGFTLKCGTISDPGKFEAEPLATYHAYHVMMDGFEDDSIGPDWRVANVICHTREDGFIFGKVFDTEQLAIDAWNQGEPYSH